MAHFERATTDLQAETTTMLDVRATFNALIAKQESVSVYIGEEADIVQSPNFENAIVKLQSKRHQDLTPEETRLMEPFKKAQIEENLVGQVRQGEIDGDEWNISHHDNRFPSLN